MKRTLLAMAAAVAVIVAAGCEPQMQINPVINRDALVLHGTSDSLVLVGKISCTRREPVDLFPTITQGDLTDRPAEVSVPCGPGQPKTYTATFRNLAPGFKTGSAQVSVDFCTNPSRPIDEDCATASRTVGILVVAT
ncbi:MAG TPA: hypothetical protein VNS19_21355 [Acidimicrobiales bacterium]|jgi:hypothetical protein|nr:hypothetical protein [Acidimicrobiales bacterium]